jgi:L-amino acid N-acyltransferase YncA
MAALQLRPYTPADAEGIVAILNYYIANSTAIYDYDLRTVAQQQTQLDEKVEKGFPVIVAMIENRLVGFGYYSEFRFRAAYRFTVEHSVYVLPNEHGQGIGKAILEALIARAREQKLHTMIGVIDAENHDSIAFHERMGFETVGVIRESGYKFDRWLHSVLLQLFV